MGKSGRKFNTLERVMTVEQFQDFAEDCSYYHFIMIHSVAYRHERYKDKSELEMRKIREESISSDLHVQLVRAEAFRLYKKVQRLVELFSVETALEEITASLIPVREMVLDYDLKKWSDRVYEEVPSLIRLKVVYELYLAMKDFLSSNEMNLLTRRDYAYILYYLYENGFLDFKGNMSLLARIGAVLYNALPMISVDDFYRSELAAVFLKDKKVKNYDIILYNLSTMKPYQIDRLVDIFENRIGLSKIANKISNDYTKAIDKHGSNYIG